MPLKRASIKTQYPPVLWLMLIVSLMLMTYFFGIKGVVQDTIRRDESTTMGHIGVMERDGQGVSLAQTIDSLLTYSGEHPPLYYLSANIWSDFVSHDYRILRVLSVLWGILAMATIYRLAANLASKQVALWCILVLSTFTFYHHYLHEIREYTTLLFWTAFVSLLYFRAISLRRQQQFMDLFVLGLSTAGAMYSHPTSIFLFIGIGFYHLFFVAKNKRWWQISTAIVLGGLTFVFWLPGLFSGVEKYSANFAGEDTKILLTGDILQELFVFWGNGSPLLFFALIIIGLVGVFKREKGSREAFLLLVVFIAFYLLTNEFFPFTKRLRYLFVFTIPYLLFVGIGLQYMSRLLRPYVIPIIVLIVWIGIGSNFYLTPSFKDAVGTTSLDTFTEYHLLMPLLGELTKPGITLVNVIYNVSTTKDSKQGGMGIDEYYESQFDIHATYIRADSRTNIVSERTLEFVDNDPDFWLNYFRAYIPGQLRDFQKKILEDYVICQEYDYGLRSRLVHYVAIKQYGILCIS